jgi:hypothetical protein
VFYVDSRAPAALPFLVKKAVLLKVEATTLSVRNDYGTTTEQLRNNSPSSFLLFRYASSISHHKFIPINQPFQLSMTDIDRLRPIMTGYDRTEGLLILFPKIYYRSCRYSML